MEKRNRLALQNLAKVLNENKDKLAIPPENRALVIPEIEKAAKIWRRIAKVGRPPNFFYGIIDFIVKNYAEDFPVTYAEIGEQFGVPKDLISKKINSNGFPPTLRHLVQPKRETSEDEAPEEDGF